MTAWMHDVPEPGTRVRFKRRVDRYDDFSVPEGAAGVVKDPPRWGPGIFVVRLDVPVPGSEPWDGEVHWYAATGEDPREDLEVID